MMKRICILIAIAVVALLAFSCASSSSTSGSSSDDGSSPTAKSGSDKIIAVGSVVELDGDESDDPDNDSLSYSWSFLSKPGSSTAILANSSTVSPSFTADVAGEYLIELEVRDGHGNSDSDSVGITAITGSMSASRTSGVAPLYVFFSSGFTSSTDSSRPFHDLEYSWDFGDSTGDSWAITGSTTGLSKNVDNGPVAAHVFATSGDYTVTLTTRDSSGSTNVETVNITVSDPDTVYSGGDTICFGDSGSDNTGCPSGATYVKSDNIFDLGYYVESGKRILLHRGSSWSASSSILTLEDVSGPVTIGAYGTCDSPDNRGICENAPVIDLAARSNFLTINASSDWRVQDLHLTGYKEYNGSVSAYRNMESLLMYRLKIEGFDLPIGIDNYNNNGHDQVAIVDCDISDGHSTGVWIGSERLAIMGNQIHGTTGEHNIRIWQAYKAVVSHNLLYESNKIALKVHGPSEDIISKTDETMLDNRSEFIYISDNIIGSTYSLAFTLGAQHSQADERLNEILVEKNRLLSGYGTPMNLSNRLTTHLSIYSSNVTVRNNVFDGSDSPSYSSAINVEKYGSAIAPSHVRIYNNTIYHEPESPSASYYGMYIYEASSVEIKNNLLHLPSGSSNQVYYCSVCEEVTSATNLLTDDPSLVDSTNADYLQRDYDLQSDSPAIDYGTDLPEVMEDFQGRGRPSGGGWDAGAFEYQ